MAKIIRNGIEYGIPSYSKNEIDRKLALKVSKSEVESELNESTNPVQSRAVKKALGDKVPQYTTMPMPNVDNVGAVAQYVGTTTVDFTNGFFYEVVEDSSSVPTIYSWQPKNVQNGTSIFYGTMDEWNALTSTEKAMYDFIATPESGEDAEKDIYSTTEVKTNKVWIDGKPIYRKVYVFSTISVAAVDWTNIVQNTQNIDEIVYCVAKLPGYGGLCNYTFRVADGYVQVLSPYATVVNKLIIEYTKTTDG